MTPQEKKESLRWDVTAMFYLVSMNGRFDDKDVNVLLDVIHKKYSQESDSQASLVQEK